MMTKEQFLNFKQKHPLDSIIANQMRDRAFDNFVVSGFPTKKDEAWKYTSLAHLNDATFDFATDENSLSHEDMKWVSSQLDSSYLNVVFTIFEQRCIQIREFVFQNSIF